ncbi:hypothetical protein niasHS_017784 [Heterodera schachtii]|uniref:C2H2-type domain-containing protein n=1 Tax=Heterodera schachtii TaxID=97005 RepID=A0ABD2I6I6_HETSC
MADEFDDATDGRLVIATDDERMDCTESAILNSGAKGRENSSSLGQNESPKGPTKTELDTLTDGCPTKPENADKEMDCWNANSMVPDSASVDSKYITNEPTGSTADEHDKLQKQSELIKWEELEGGVVPSTESKSLESERVPRGSEAENKRHFTNESNKSSVIAQSQHGVHNFLHGGGDSKKKKLMSDKGTCVLSRPTGVHGLDEHLLAMRPGTNLTIDITIICKAGSNTLYISAKWKGREYHGVLTDGEPLFSHTYAQKRNAAQNAEKFAFENATGSNGNTANQKAQNAEKPGGGGMSGKRGGKRGVGGQPKGGSGEKRAKNQQTECQSVGDAKEETPRSSNNEEKVRTESSDGIVENAELGGGRQQTEEKPMGHAQGHNQQHHRRRTSSSASSGACVVKSGLYDADAASRMRCPHEQCGHRFETASELNAHLLIGTHRMAGEKAKIFEATASQTSSVQRVSVGCDPCFSSAASINTKDTSFCAKCQKELAPEKDKAPLEEVKRPQLFECDDGNGEKSKQKVAADNSPGFSDISDDAAPTLEKEESFDKQNDEAKKLLPSSAPAASVPSDAPNGTDGVTEEPSTSATHQQQNSFITNDSPLHPLSTDNKNDNETPSKSAAVSIIRQNLLTHSAKTKTADESTANGATKPVAKKTSSSVAATLAKTPTTTATTGNLGELNVANGNSPFLMASTSEMTAAAAPGFPFSQFLPFAPHLSQAFASALAQGTVPIGVVPSSIPSASPLGPSSSALAAGLKLMSPPSAAGLLSLGTPLAASVSQMPNCSGAPSKSAEPPAISQPIQHKIYELQQQQQQSGALLGRSSSTKPSTSASVGHAQSIQVGTPGAMGGGANAASTVDMALMRPNSAISAVGHNSHNQQQHLHNSQLHPSISQMPPQVNRQCPPGAPSPIGSVGVSAASAGPVMHHLPAPPLHHAFFPPLSSLIAGAGAQFGIPPGSAAASNILAAAQQQQQQQMAAFRRNNSASVGQSGAVTTNQQQQAVTAAQQPNASLLPPFVPQGLPPGMLAAAAASNFDLNALQHYAAALIASAPSSDGLGNASSAATQQQHPNQK